MLKCIKYSIIKYYQAPHIRLNLIENIQIRTVQKSEIKR